MTPPADPSHPDHPQHAAFKWGIFFSVLASALAIAAPEIAALEPGSAGLNAALQGAGLSLGRLTDAFGAK